MATDSLYKPSLYVETSIPSYLAARPSRDLLVAAHQQVTHEWWRTAKEDSFLFVSEAVMDEIQAGDADAAKRRMALVADIPILEYTDDVRELVDLYRRELGFQGRALVDIPHLAFCVAYETDYMVTWNCAHLASATTLRRLKDLNLREGLFLPLILTPVEIMGFEGTIDDD